MARKEPMKIAKIKDATFTELASGTGTKITREQLISKILSYRSEIFRLRSSWLKKMNDDTATTENKLKLLEIDLLQSTEARSSIRYESNRYKT